MSAPFIRPISPLRLWISRVWLKDNLNLRGGILMSIGNFPKSLSQALSVGIMLEGRLGVLITSNNNNNNDNTNSNVNNIKNNNAHVVLSTTIVLDVVCSKIIVGSTITAWTSLICAVYNYVGQCYPMDNLNMRWRWFWLYYSILYYNLL